MIDKPVEVIQVNDQPASNQPSTEQSAQLYIDMHAIITDGQCIYLEILHLLSELFSKDYTNMQYEKM